MLDIANLCGDTMTLRQGTMSYVWSQMTVVNTLSTAANKLCAQTITFIDMLEALGRVADIYAAALPTREQLRKVGYTHVLEYALEQDNDASNAPATRHTRWQTARSSRNSTSSLSSCSAAYTTTRPSRRRATRTTSRV